ncbi:hypothetical protein FGO68_gene3667 [Halteria grandinella]|uniref:Uncharacterized protein n=1 Tax=Halteria grandinella TaxID=5974 RepID=A0A8J8T1W4_HALGN|nr:hypothetical protein FGO68_gene3667 [Halteria grandinella]
MNSRKGQKICSITSNRNLKKPKLEIDISNGESQTSIQKGFGEIEESQECEQQQPQSMLQIEIPPSESTFGAIAFENQTKPHLQMQNTFQHKKTLKLEPTQIRSKKIYKKNDKQTKTLPRSQRKSARTNIEISNNKEQKDIREILQELPELVHDQLDRIIKFALKNVSLSDLDNKLIRPNPDSLLLKIMDSSQGQKLVARLSETCIKEELPNIDVLMSSLCQLSTFKMKIEEEERWIQDKMPPDQTVTEADIAAVLAHTLNITNKSGSPGFSLNAYTDFVRHRDMRKAQYKEFEKHGSYTYQDDFSFAERELVQNLVKKIKEIYEGETPGEREEPQSPRYFKKKPYKKYNCPRKQLRNKSGARISIQSDKTQSGEESSDSQKSASETKVEQTVEYCDYQNS